MKAKLATQVGWLLSLGELMVIVLSNKIVFPGLERVVGIETIVGRDNVVYQPDGGYLFTNPGAMMHWILSVAAVGVLACSSGIWLLLRTRRIEHAGSDAKIHTQVG